VRQTSRSASLSLSLPLSLLLWYVSLILLAIPGCMHTCVQGMRSLSSPFGARLWRGPLPRGGIEARCCRCCMSLGRRCRRRYASGGARRCHIDRALVTGEATTNERTNERASERTYECECTFFPPFCHFLNVSFFLVFCTVLYIRFSCLSHYPVLRFSSDIGRFIFPFPLSIVFNETMRAQSTRHQRDDAPD